MSARTHAARIGAILAASGLVVAGVVPTAAAHVTVSSPDAKPGGYAKLVFRVPTESDTANTTKLIVTLPEQYPFASARPQVKPGWKVTKTERKLDTPIDNHGTTLSKVVGTVTWTAVSAGVAPGEFDEFALSVGRLPEKVDALSFPAEQTYSDGEVVKWSETQQDGAEEPEHPAPLLKLVATQTTPSTPPAPADDSDLVARLLGGGGLLLGLAGLALGLRRRGTVPA